MPSRVYLGIFENHFDPAVAIVRDGQVLAYAEEERFIRQKHAYRVFPARALKFCLDTAGIGPADVAAIGVNWNLKGFSNGEMASFFDRMAAEWPLDDNTRGWQRSMLANYNEDAFRARIAAHWRRIFGSAPMPPLHAVPHHYAHALHAFLPSGFDEALCLTVDGSGDEHCTVLWECRGHEIRPLREITMPHSLGWFYAAFTEYLGFQAYDGEYKVMGLAAFGRSNADLRSRVEKILHPDEDGIGYRLDPSYIHYGPRNWSDRFTDYLPELFGRPMRLDHEPIDDWHEDLAFEVQRALEDSVCRLAQFGLTEMGTRNLCIGGGVGLNVKMNSRLFDLEEVSDIFPQPLCSDGGAAAAAALGACWELEGARPTRQRTLALGNEHTDEDIAETLRRCGIAFEQVPDIAVAAASELAEGKVVGWFQGRMEAGPRALGQRSILADPRREAMRDKVNAAIKYREYWRPFCPSMRTEDASRYLHAHTDAPFMIIAFRARDALREQAPAIVHVDGTVRVQLVDGDDLPLYHRLLTEFGRQTGVPVLLNTSFNVKGEPVVCTIHDALRTFFSTGLDVLAAGNCLVRKPAVPVAPDLGTMESGS